MQVASHGWYCGILLHLLTLWPAAQARWNGEHRCCLLQPACQHSAAQKIREMYEQDTAVRVRMLYISGCRNAFNEKSDVLKDLTMTMIDASSSAEQKEAARAKLTQASEDLKAAECASLSFSCF
jgi:hypothetical protein